MRVIIFIYGHEKNGLTYPFSEALDDLYTQTSKSARTTANIYLFLEYMKVSNFQKTRL